MSSSSLALIADDNSSSLLMLGYMLESFGCTVLSARDGAEAIALVQNTLPDIAFLDLSMPVMDGFEAIKELRRLFNRRMPVYALSAHCHEEQLKEKALAMGADDCICKPIEMELIEATLRHHKLLGIAGEEGS